MADTTQKFSTFSCEISILEAKNIEFTSPKRVFVRYYLSAGNNKRVRLNTKQISSTSIFVWNECFSLECLGSKESIHSLKQATVVFELRRANKLGFVGSQLLGRGEIPWEEVFESPNMGIEKWVCLVCGGGQCELGLLKQPIMVKVGMRVRAGEEIMEMEKKIMRRKHIDEWCGCKSHHMPHCADHEVFALAAAMEFL